jgi:hypothetical protein
VKLCRRYDFGELLHVCGLDVNNVEALILNVQVPEVNPKVVTANKRFTIAVHRNAVDMIGVRVGIRLLRYCGHHSVMMRHPR